MDTIKRVIGNFLFRAMPDKIYLKFIFKKIFGYKLDLNNPKTFNEKLQWLKLYDRNKIYTNLVDKYKVRDYVKKVIGEEYLIPLLGVWDKPENIDFSVLPEKFVLKCNHNSGLGMYICTDKSKIDEIEVRKELKKGLRENYYKTQREWPYKNVNRKIIAEKYIEVQNNSELVDYKFMCFNGKVKCSFVCNDRFSENGLKVTFFDRDWNVMPFIRHYPKSKYKIEKPHNYEKMIEIAEKLSKDIAFVRVDLYDVNNKIYFGEMTFFPESGLEEFEPFEWDIKLGAWITLPSKLIKKEKG